MTKSVGGAAPAPTPFEQEVGARIRVRLAEHDMEGVFEDIDEEGALILRDVSGARTRITAGDVFFTA